MRLTFWNANRGISQVHLLPTGGNEGGVSLQADNGTYHSALTPCGIPSDGSVSPLVRQEWRIPVPTYRLQKAQQPAG